MQIEQLQQGDAVERGRQRHGLARMGPALGDPVVAAGEQGLGRPDQLRIGDDGRHQIGQQLALVVRQLEGFRRQLGEDRLRRGVRRRRTCRNAGPDVHLRDHAFNQRLQQVVACLEVIDEPGLGDIGRRRHGVDGELLYTLLGDDIGCGIEKTVA